MPAEKYPVPSEFTGKMWRQREGCSAWGNREEGIASRHAGCLENTGDITNGCVSYKGAILVLPLSVPNLMYGPLKSAYRYTMGEGMLE